MRAPVMLIAALSVFSTRAAAQTTTYLYSFTGGSGGFSPAASLTEISPGLFLGAAAGQPPSGGPIFTITPSGSYTQLSTLDAYTQGDGAQGQLIPASNGLLYGVTNSYGPDQYGTIFATTPAGRVSVVQTFVTTPSPLTEASDGNFYGINANYDGVLSTPTFFRMTPSGEMTTLFTFPSPSTVSSALLQAGDGDFYGGTNGFAASGTVVGGTLFKLTPKGKYTLLHTFDGAAGAEGAAGVGGNFIQASNGLIYGSTFVGFGSCQVSRGVVFSLSPKDGDFKVIHEFECSGDGSGVVSGLTEASDGYLYGTCATCGLQMDGGLFKLSLDGSEYTNIVTLAGALFYASGPGMVQGSDGNLYGTAPGGGTHNEGFIFELAVGAPPPLPQLSYARPSSASPGTKVIIRGNNFLAASQVTFNGIPAAFSVRDVEYIAATVPAGATSGTITVTTPNGTGTSKFSFTVE